MASHDDLLQQGIAAARAGQLDQARQLLAQAIKVNPRSESAWIWMSSVVGTNEQRIQCLQQVIAINPDNELALKGLKALTASVEPAAPPSPPPAPPQVSPPAEVYAAPAAAPVEPPPVPPAAPPPAPQPVSLPPPPAPDGVPLIDPMQIAAAQREVEGILRQLREQSLSPFPQVQWAQPEALQGRSRSTLGAFAPLAVVISASLVIVVLVILFGSTIIGIISGRQRVGILSGSTAAPVRATSAPIVLTTRTPTPAGTPYDPGPATIPADAPHVDLSFGRPRPTAAYVLTPHPSSSSMGNALKVFYQGDYNGALDEVSRARAAGDDSLDGYFVEGMSLAHLNQLDQAIAAFNDGLNKNENFAPLHAGLASVYLQKTKLEQARAEAEKAVSLDNQLVMGYVVLAQVQLLTGDTDTALKTITDAKSKTSQYDVNLIVAEGNVYLAQGDYEKATNSGNLAYYIDPSSEGAVLLLARGQVALKLVNSAMVVLENYIQTVNPSSSDSWALLARIYSQAGRLSDALEATNRALQLSTNQSDALVARGMLYLEQGKIQQACDDLNNAIQKDDQNYEARLGRAQCSFALGDYDHTLSDLEFVRAATPDNPIVQTLYVQTLIKKERYNDAISAASAAYKRGLLTPEQRAFVLESWGYALYKEGNYDEAAGDIEAALKISETGTRHYIKGLILQGKKDYRRASTEFEWVLFWNQIYNYPFAADAQAHLVTVYGFLGKVVGTPTPTVTPTPKATPTKAPSATPSPTASPTPAKPGTPTPTPGKTSTVTPTPGKTTTPTLTPPKSATPGVTPTK
jgi:tetratricopeptide (TPR) repeat protein